MASVSVLGIVKNMQRNVRLFHQEISCRYFLLVLSSPHMFSPQTDRRRHSFDREPVSVQFVQYTDPSAYFTHALIASTAKGMVPVHILRCENKRV
jgi:hypothetical protein